jgi:hypothetical protein
MYHFFLKTLGLMLIVLIPFNVSAQSKAIQRFQLGYSFPMTTAKYTESYTIFQDLNAGSTDTSVSKNVKTKGGFGFTLGSYFPVAQMGEKSSLNIGVDFLYNLLVWDAQMIDVSGYDYETGSYNYTTNYVISAATVHWGLPVGIDFKTGGEATLDRSSRLSMTLGTGLYPSLNLTVFETNAGAKFKMQPYLKAEAGIFAGINWKVRALYSFGKLEYIGYSDTEGGSSYAYQSSASLMSKSSLTLSVLVMPGSFKWGKNEWWK